MKKKKEAGISKTGKETEAALKNETQKTNGVKKGYNEKNPTQPQGAFKPDAAEEKN